MGAYRPRGRRGRGTTRAAFTLTIVGACAALLTAGCGRGPGAASTRVLEREEQLEGVSIGLRSELDPARGTLGDPITWRLTASLGAGAAADSVILGPAHPSLDLDASRPVEATRSRNASVRSRVVVLRGFDLGRIELPPAALPVRIGGRSVTLEFPRDTLFVDSLTPAATGSIHPDRGPIDPELRALDYAVAGIAALLLAGLLAMLARAILRARRQSAAAAAPAPEEPPEQRLKRSIAALRREFASLPRDVFYDRLSLALRAYTGSVAGIPALDLTTTELERELERFGAAPEGRRRLIGALRRADLAKFARFEDPETEAMAVLDDAADVEGRLTRPFLASSGST